MGQQLEGQVAVVTGASRGIGAAIAARFAEEGARVICAARTLREGDHPLAGSLEKTVADIQAAGGLAHPVAVNLANPADCQRLIRATLGPSAARPEPPLFLPAGLCRAPSARSQPRR